jgi:hypothetical protein
MRQGQEAGKVFTTATRCGAFVAAGAEWVSGRGGRSRRLRGAKFARMSLLE